MPIEEGLYWVLLEGGGAGKLLTLRWRVHLFPRAAITKYHQLGGLRQHIIVSLFKRQEVQDQGVCRALVPQKHVEHSSWPPPSFQWFAGSDSPRRSLACRWITPVSAFIITYLLPAYLFSSSDKETQIGGLPYSRMTSS